MVFRAHILQGLKDYGLLSWRDFRNRCCLKDCHRYIFTILRAEMPKARLLKEVDISVDLHWMVSLWIQQCVTLTWFKQQRGAPWPWAKSFTVVLNKSPCRSVVTQPSSYLALRKSGDSQRLFAFADDQPPTTVLYDTPINDNLFLLLFITCLASCFWCEYMQNTRDTNKHSNVGIQFGQLYRLTIIIFDHRLPRQTNHIHIFQRSV